MPSSVATASDSQSLLCLPESDLLGESALLLGLRVRDASEYIETLSTLSLLVSSSLVPSVAAGCLPADCALALATAGMLHTDSRVRASAVSFIWSSLTAASSLIPPGFQDLIVDSASALQRRLVS